ncbi:MAG TPA: hypothetical protein VNY05_03445 [Candidatus Acidoferrales bacterium]|nr:hypothetical protein [Candidatus Acidoferrales bacterium]
MAPATAGAVEMQLGMQVEMLRHTVATLAYRGGKTLRGAPPDFSAFRAGEGTSQQSTGQQGAGQPGTNQPGTRQPGQILAHMCDLLDWALKLADGTHEWREKPPQLWEQDTARFFAGLEALDQRLASTAPLGVPAGKLFQGPIADALTHTGQIAMLRRMAGAPVRSENYFKADIQAGRAGADQSPPRFEFD